MRGCLAVGLGLVLGVVAASARDDTVTTSATQPATSPATWPATQPSGEMLKKHDKDGDGKLSDQERQAMMQDFLKVAYGQLDQLALRRYDANNNGAWDADEKAKAQQLQAKLKGQAQKAQQEWIMSWDKDGNGEFSAEEARQMRAESAKLEAEHLNRWDMDGDGKVTGEESRLAIVTQNTESTKRLLEMDSDGDGQVTPQEEQTYWQQIRAKYDLDNDGKLSDDEEQRMREQETLVPEAWFLSGAWRVGGAGGKHEPPAPQGGSRPTASASAPATQPSREMLKIYHDKDGDGELSGQERQAMMQDLLKQAQQEVLQLWLRRYDANNNGALDAEETAKMQQEREQEQDKFTEQLRKAHRDYVMTWDKDGDGSHSAEEMKQLLAESAKLKAEHVNRWDMDGDGELSPEESRLASWTKGVEWEKRRLEMDSDGDGQVTPQEEQTYWQQIRAKYDLDKDGKLSDQEGQRMRKGEKLGGEEWILSGGWDNSGAGGGSRGTTTRGSGDTKPAPSTGPTTRRGQPTGSLF
jgi:Ca2+-binding EF-hand superfamily protein